jgi:DNA modification methylase
LILSNIDQFRYKFYWEKPRGANFAQSTYRPLQVIEEIIVFSSSPAVYSNAPTMVFNPQTTKREKPYYREFKKGHQVISTQHDGAFLRNPEKGVGKRYYDKAHPRSLLYYSIDGDETTSHPTQKPVDLMAYLIRTYTNPSEIILDNTAGSFTTAVACIKEGRRFVGIEKEEEYCRIGKERIIEALLASGNVQASCDTIDTQKLGYQLGLPLQDYQIPEKV